jgi:hypothetical protein
MGWPRRVARLADPTWLVAAFLLACGRAVIGLNSERQTWTVFTLERKGKEVYSFRDDPGWEYLPAGPIATSRLCRQPVRVADDPGMERGPRPQPKRPLT